RRVRLVARRLLRLVCGLELGVRRRRFLLRRLHLRARARQLLARGFRLRVRRRDLLVRRVAARARRRQLLARRLRVGARGVELLARGVASLLCAGGVVLRGGELIAQRVQLGREPGLLALGRGQQRGALAVAGHGRLPRLLQLGAELLRLRLRRRVALG